MKCVSIKIAIAFIIELVRANHSTRGRRIQKLVSTNNGSAYFGEYTNKFTYDGWNCMAVLNPLLDLQQSFMWGLDLSETQQGAGGVGGLLAENLGTNGLSFAVYDGNGDVTLLLNAGTQVPSARYEYGPCAEIIRVSGLMAFVNPYRFSTKRQDGENGFLYYGYRYFNSSTARWCCRDPLKERMGPNLYLFLKNSCVNTVDSFGLCGYGDCGADVTQPLTAVLNEVKTSFKTSQFPDNKMKACLTLVGLSSGGDPTTAWDILELGPHNGPYTSPFSLGTGSCHYSVVVAGGCFHSWAVNYSLWGAVMKLCFDFVPNRLLKSGEYFEYVFDRGV